MSFSLCSSETNNKFNKTKKVEVRDYSTAKLELNGIWKDFMSSFNYEKYYHFDKFTKSSKNINDSNIFDYSNSIITRSLSIKSLNKFFKKYSINILDNQTLYINYESDNSKNLSELLSESKLWIMYIIITLHRYNNNVNESNSFENKINLIVNLFNEAVRKKCDLISLFEFFLIYISFLSKEEYNLFQSSQMIKLLPREFILLYSQKKEILKNIFSKNEEINFLAEKIDLVGDETNFFSEKTNFELDGKLENNKGKEREKNNQDDNCSQNENKNFINDENVYITNENNIQIRIIDKNYLNTGYFALFEEKNSTKEIDMNINYIIMPLKQNFSNYKEKIEAEKILNKINNSIYRDFIYYPYNSQFISQL